MEKLRGGHLVLLLSPLRFELFDLRVTDKGRTWRFVDNSMKRNESHKVAKAPKVIVGLGDSSTALIY